MDHSYIGQWEAKYPRTPPEMIVMDSQSGKEITPLATSEATFRGEENCRWGSRICTNRQMQTIRLHR